MYVTSLKFKVELGPLTLCKICSDLSLCPIFSFVVCDGISKLYGINDHHNKRMCGLQVIYLKFKVTLHT